MLYTPTKSKKMMKKVNSQPLYILLAMVLMLVFFSTTFSGCSPYETYTGTIGGASFSFQHRKDDMVNPYDPYGTWSGISHPPPEVLRITEGQYYPDHHIKVEVRAGESAEKSAENFLEPLSKNQYITDLKVWERGTVTIAGLPAQYIRYTYYGYTTVRVPYEGIFASFVYNPAYNGHSSRIVDIDVLFKQGNGDTDIAFHLLVDTFKIKQ
jgi:hypothetical protein